MRKRVVQLQSHPERRSVINEEGNMQEKAREKIHVE
jgi:hypothetical protein